MNSFDLDINNYTIGELIRFFKLDDHYSADDLDNKEGELINSILKVYKDTDVVYRNEIVQFIKTGKQILVGKTTTRKPTTSVNRSKQNGNNNNNNNNNGEFTSFATHVSTPSTIDESLDANITNKSNIPSNLPNLYNNVGKIINPASNHPALQSQSIPSNSANGYNTHTQTSNYIFNTRFRDNFFSTIPSNCSFTLPNKIKNVISVSLSGIQIPNVANTFASSKETNQLYIYEDTTGLNAIVKIPSGNYNIFSFATALEKAINEQVIGSNPNRFTVTINNSTNTLNIINSTYTFQINILKKTSSIDKIFDCAEFKFTYVLNNNSDNVDIKKQIKPSEYFTTMGYLMGFRQITYIGAKSYTCEAPFDDTLQDYYYFELNDYNDYQNESTYGVLPTYILSKNIIAVLPITTPKYISSFDNNSNFIYKTRNYNGPVDISKISIRMLGGEGGLVDLHSVDYAFVLQVTTIYDNMMPYNQTDVSII